MPRYRSKTDSPRCFWHISGTAQTHHWYIIKAYRKGCLLARRRRSMQANGWNPYHVHTPISDPDMFFGPSSVLRQTFSDLANQQNVSLVGLRHSGKTSLLHWMRHPMLQTRFDFDLSHHLFVYLDIRKWLRKSCNDFFEIVSEEIIAASQEHLALAPTSKTGEDCFSFVLEQVKGGGFHTVLQLDAFDDIVLNKAFDPEFFMFLRAMASAGLVSYVTASIAPLSQIAHPAIQSSPFFNIFVPCFMEPLTPQEARDLVVIPSLQANCSLEAEAGWILRYAGYHPFFIQSVCYYCLKEKFQQRGGKVNSDKVFNLAYRDLSPHFEYLWEKLDATQKEAMKEEAQHNDGSERQIPELSESSLFRKFVRDTCGLVFFHMTGAEIEEELREALKHLDSSASLANSKLRYLKQVIARCEQQHASSAFEKGRIIREILKEASEQLCGQPSRTDTDPEWLLYNILHYTYFKKTNGFTQEHIANHLGVSLRQYHRKKDEAIAELCNYLLEIETTCKGEDEE